MYSLVNDFKTSCNSQRVSIDKTASKIACNLNNKKDGTYLGKWPPENHQRNNER